MGKNKLFSITRCGVILMFAIIAFCIHGSNVQASNVWDGKTSEKFEAGSGTKEDPYQIATGAQLSYLAKGVDNGTEGKKDQYYKLTDDIDLGGHNWNPIGYCKRELSIFYGGNYFYGVFEGNNHTIKNLNIVQSNPNKDNYYYGLFAWNSGIIQNLNVTNANINCDGVSYVGGIASVNEGKINQCSLDGSVTIYNDLGGCCWNSRKTNK